MYTIELSARLNGVQGDVVIKENTSRGSRQTHFFSSKLWPDYLCHTQNTYNEAKEVPEREGLAYWGIVFLGHSSPVVACMPPQTRKGRSPAAEQLFAMQNIHYTV